MLEERNPQSEEHTSITKPENYFKLGRIFSVTPTDLEKEPNKVRTYVVMRACVDSSICCLLRPNMTRDFRKPFEAQNLALIYNVDGPKLLSPGEQPPGMGEFPMIVENTSIKIDPTLRLDFGKVCTIEHDVAVRNVGRIDRKCLKTLKSTFLKAMGASDPGDKITEDVKVGVDQPSNAQSRLPDSEQVKPIAAPHAKKQTGLILKELPALVISKHSQELLSFEFKVHKSKEFQKGRAFKILWSEPSASNVRLYGSTEPAADEIVMEQSKFGESAYHSIRRFIIVKARDGHCLCIPILTYRGRGTAKAGVKAADHAVIYTSSTPPQTLPEEKPSMKTSIRMEIYRSGDELAPTSRVNYNKLYTVEHNVKVCFVGKIHKDSEARFYADFRRAFDNDE